MEAGKARMRFCSDLHEEFLDDFFLPAMAAYTRAKHTGLSQDIHSSLRQAREKARGVNGQMNSQMALSIDSSIVEQVLTLVRAYQKVKAPFYRRASPGDVMLKDFRPKAILKEEESLEKKVVCILILIWMQQVNLRVL